MAQPFDYSLNLPSGFQSFGQGYQFGAGLAQAEAQRIAAQQAAEVKRQQQQVLASFLDNPNPTAQDFMRTAAVLPKEQAEMLRQGFEALGKERQQNDLRFAGQAMAALQAGKPEMAQSLLRERAQAEMNAGNSYAAKQYEVFAELAKTSPDAALKSIGIVVAQLPGGDKVLEGFSRLGEEQRKAALQPGEIDKQAADLGLTRAQTNQVMAQTSKLGIEAQRAAIELAALKSGNLTPEQQAKSDETRFNQEEKLRKEWSGRTTRLTEAKANIATIRASAADGTGAGDIALITSFMKMLDPGSVVRETEFATARDTGGLLTKLQGLATKVRSGSFLSDEQRKSFSKLAGDYLAAAEKEGAVQRQQLMNVVDTYGLDEANVFGSRAVTGGGPQGGRNLPQGQRNIAVDY